MGAGQLLTAAAKLRAIPQDAVRPLRYAVSVANRAVHGEPVEVEQALEALESAETGLSLIAHWQE